MGILQIILQIVIGLGTVIPLVIQLIKYVKIAIKEKNWASMVALSLELIKSAEQSGKSGADKKAWVMNMVEASARSINYAVDEEALSNMIDDIVETTKVVNKN